jgi:hypothetical protein
MQQGQARAVIDAPLKDIVLDSRLQMRAEMHRDIIDEYSEAVNDLPPGSVVQIEGSVLLLTDGWHSYHAHKAKGKTTMKVYFREGTFLDALLEAAGANFDHGLRRTIDDKARAVAAVLTEPAWSEKSDRFVATTCHVSHPFVARIREELNGHATDAKEANDKAKKAAKKPAKKTKAASKTSKKKEEKKKEAKDELPKSVQNALADTWHAECAMILSRMRAEAKSAFSWSSWLDPNVLEHLKAAEDMFKTAVPTKVCPDCSGQKQDKGKACQRCRQGGYLGSQT